MRRETVGGILSVLLTWGIMFLAKDTHTLLVAVAAFALNIPLAFIFSKGRGKRTIALVFLHYCYVTLAVLVITLIAVIVYFLVTFKKYGG